MPPGEVVSETTDNETPPQPDPTDITAQALSHRIPVIMYHDIIEKRNRDSVWFDCTKDEFEKQMQQIELAGYTPISLDQLYAHLTKGTELPDKPIVLTFDDNYQGFYDFAYPILAQFKYPAAIFVHTKFVGQVDKHPKMTWETLKELKTNYPMITIGSHTVSHPDMIGMPEEQQRMELETSKREIESNLGITCDILAYPEGKYDETTLALTKELGYKMAVTVDNGPAEMSPDVYRIGRYIHTRLDKALEECEQSLRSAPGVVTQDLADTPVELEDLDVGPFNIVIIKGGTLKTITSPTRESVSDFIKRSDGAVAGINGTFFPLAAIAATDNRLMGPSISPDRPEFFPDDDSTRWPRLKNRPLVLWNDRQMMLAPFVPDWMNIEERAKGILPGVTNLFLSGAWLVHDGVAFPEVDLRAFSAQDVMDFRRRAAFGILNDGRPFGAATKGSVSSLQFAEALAAQGVKEAVLLDSGFSTSLVYDAKIIASGHSTASQPSRPVPHAILFYGSMDPDSQALAAKLDLGTPKPESSTRRRRTRRR